MTAITATILQTKEVPGALIVSEALEAITRGQFVYTPDLNNTFGIAKNTTAEKAIVAGIALASCALGDDFPLLLGDNNVFILDNTLTGLADGLEYYIGNNGQLVEIGDLGSGAWKTLVAFYSSSDDSFKTHFYPTGKQIA